MNSQIQNLKQFIIDKSAELGFIKIGFAKADIFEREANLFQQWLDLNFNADMNWLKTSAEKRKNIFNVLPEAKSVISLAYNYFTPFNHSESKPKISRYAWGNDYHKVLKPKLKQLSQHIIDYSNQLNFDYELKLKYFTDDGPVMDKLWARKAGIGWIGKHTNIINPDIGSWFFLSEIITNIDFVEYSLPINDLCGSCNLCVTACPTGAIVDDYLLDANKCISYHTIENRGDIPDDIDLNGWLFGCDICQDVCPFNSTIHNVICKDESFYPNDYFISLLNLNNINNLNKEIDLNTINQEQFDKIFLNSPIKRTKYTGFKRNLAKIQK